MGTRTSTGGGPEADALHPSSEPYLGCRSRIQKPSPRRAGRCASSDQHLFCQPLDSPPPGRWGGRQDNERAAARSERAEDRDEPRCDVDQRRTIGKAATSSHREGLAPRMGEQRPVPESSCLAQSSSFSIASCRGSRISRHAHGLLGQRGSRDLDDDARRRWVDAANEFGRHAVRVDLLLVRRPAVPPRQRPAVFERADYSEDAVHEPWAEEARSSE